MRPEKRASIAAWPAVAVTAVGCTIQFWPENPDREGFRSDIGTQR
jgi:hypothetical protein